MSAARDVTCLCDVGETGVPGRALATIKNFKMERKLQRMKRERESEREKAEKAFNCTYYRILFLRVWRISYRCFSDEVYARR